MTTASEAALAFDRFLDASADRLLAFGPGESRRQFWFAGLSWLRDAISAHAAYMQP